MSLKFKSRIYLTVVFVLMFFNKAIAQVDIRKLHSTHDNAEFGCCQLVDSSKIITCVQETSFAPFRKHRIIIYKTDLNFISSQVQEISLGQDTLLIPRSIVKIGEQYIVGGHGGVYGEKDFGDYLFTFAFTVVLNAKLQVISLFVYPLAITQPYNIYDSKLIVASPGELIGLFEVRLIGKTIYANNSLNRFNLYCRYNDSIKAYDFLLDSNNYRESYHENLCRITNDLVKTEDGDYLGTYMSRLSWEGGNPITKKINYAFSSVSNKDGMILTSQKSYLHYHNRDRVIVSSVLYGDADPFDFSGTEGNLQTAIIYRSDTSMGYVLYDAIAPRFTSFATVTSERLEMANHEGMALDGAGNYYLAYQYGSSYPSQTYTDTLFIIKCNRDLKHIWTKKLSFPMHNIFLNEIHVTYGGIVFLVGTDYAFGKNGTGQGLPDLFLLKLDSNGSEVLGTKEINHAEMNVAIYPNPFIDKLRISSSKLVDEVKLTNLAGLTQYFLDVNEGVYDTHNIPVGVYILEVKTANSIYRKKVIKVE